MDDAPATLTKLGSLKRLGVQLAIDDFGTGFSSLSYLRQFPVDTVKIDQSFIRTLRRTQRSSAIVRAVTTLAHDLGMNVVAEGIETAAQLAALREAHCDFGQGFFYSAAVPASAIVPMLRQRLNGGTAGGMVQDREPHMTRMRQRTG